MIKNIFIVILHCCCHPTCLKNDNDSVYWHYCYYYCITSSTGFDECLILYGDTQGCINIFVIKSAGECLRLVSDAFMQLLSSYVLFLLLPSPFFLRGEGQLRVNLTVHSTENMLCMVCGIWKCLQTFETKLVKSRSVTSSIISYKSHSFLEFGNTLVKLYYIQNVIFLKLETSGYGRRCQNRTKLVKSRSVTSSIISYKSHSFLEFGNTHVKLYCIQNVIFFLNWKLQVMEEDAKTGWVHC